MPDEDDELRLRHRRRRRYDRTLSKRRDGEEAADGGGGDGGGGDDDDRLSAAWRREPIEDDGGDDGWRKTETRWRWRNRSSAVASISLLLLVVAASPFARVHAQMPYGPSQLEAYSRILQSNNVGGFGQLFTAIAQGRSLADLQDRPRLVGLPPLPPLPRELKAQQPPTTSTTSLATSTAPSASPLTSAASLVPSPAPAPAIVLSGPYLVNPVPELPPTPEDRRRGVYDDDGVFHPEETQPQKEERLQLATNMIAGTKIRDFAESDGAGAAADEQMLRHDGAHETKQITSSSDLPSTRVENSAGADEPEADVVEKRLRAAAASQSHRTRSEKLAKRVRPRYYRKATRHSALSGGLRMKMETSEQHLPAIGSIARQATPAAPVQIVPQQQQQQQQLIAQTNSVWQYPSGMMPPQPQLTQQQPQQMFVTSSTTRHFVPPPRSAVITAATQHHGVFGVPSPSPQQQQQQQQQVFPQLTQQWQPQPQSQQQQQQQPLVYPQQQQQQQPRSQRVMPVPPAPPAPDALTRGRYIRAEMTQQPQRVFQPPPPPFVYRPRPTQPETRDAQTAQLLAEVEEYDDFQEQEKAYRMHYPAAPSPRNPYKELPPGRRPDLRAMAVQMGWTVAPPPPAPVPQFMAAQPAQMLLQPQPQQPQPAVATLFPGAPAMFPALPATATDNPLFRLFNLFTIPPQQRQPQTAILHQQQQQQQQSVLSPTPAAQPHPARAFGSPFALGSSSSPSSRPAMHSGAVAQRTIAEEWRKLMDVLQLQQDRSATLNGNGVLDVDDIDDVDGETEEVDDNDDDNDDEENDNDDEEGESVIEDHPVLIAHQYQQQPLLVDLAQRPVTGGGPAATAAGRGIAAAHTLPSQSPAQLLVPNLVPTEGTSLLTSWHAVAGGHHHPHNQLRQRHKQMRTLLRS